MPHRDHCGDHLAFSHRQSRTKLASVETSAQPAGAQPHLRTTQHALLQRDTGLYQRLLVMPAHCGDVGDGIFDHAICSKLTVLVFVLDQRQLYPVCLGKLCQIRFNASMLRFGQ
ncbi:hypothetical protein SDC9_204620 [bioreactor metagenome]|uniref:Uncharacterized protein n=1 Tax=bioreactor metagenome TaxID=1076179 RepID=A0A645J0J5_9ZZZZ